VRPDIFKHRIFFVFSAHISLAQSALQSKGDGGQDGPMFLKKAILFIFLND
jgi:hypothetical protein